jgi:tRNA(fMet)-specific endonuclease VapC
VVTRLLDLSPDDIGVAMMTVAELWFGALKSTDPARGRALTDAFLRPLVLLPFEQDAAERYGHARLHLEARGTPIGERDLIIAATALAYGLTVVTNNVSEFGRVPGLDVEDWTKK